MIEEIKSKENSLKNISSAMVAMILWARLVFNCASSLAELKDVRINMNEIGDILDEKQAKLEVSMRKLSNSWVIFKEINQKIEKAKSS